MLQENKHWSSGYWQVSEGRAEEFVDRWRAFLTWTRQANDGFLGARLIRNLQTPNHFVSFAAWRDLAALLDWQAKPEFGEHYNACRALCDDTRTGGFELVAGT